MNLDALHNGSTVVLDSNILIYARRGATRQGMNLLARCQAEAITGVVTSFVIAEFCHWRMMQECQALGFACSNPAKARSPKSLTLFAG
jgi:predicted nucleic acid-binding protein